MYLILKVRRNTILTDFDKLDDKRTEIKIMYVFLVRGW